MINFLIHMSFPMVVIGILLLLGVISLHTIGRLGSLIIPEFTQSVILFVSILVFSVGLFYCGANWDIKRNATTIAGFEAKQKMADAQIDSLNQKLSQSLNQKVEVITKVQKQVVTKYVTKHSDSACVVPVGFIRLHDSAATGSVIPPSSENYDAPSGVPLSLVADTVKDNYSAYNRLAAQHEALINWVLQTKNIQDSVVKSK